MHHRGREVTRDACFQPDRQAIFGMFRDWNCALFLHNDPLLGWGLWKLIQWSKWQFVAGGSRRGAEGAENETPWASRMGREYLPLQLTMESGGTPWAPPTGSGAEPRPIINLMHFICYRTLLVEEKSNVFNDNYYGTNELTIVIIRWNPQIKHHNMKF